MIRGARSRKSSSRRQAVQPPSSRSNASTLPQLELTIAPSSTRSQPSIHHASARSFQRHISSSTTHTGSSAQATRHHLQSTPISVPSRSFKQPAPKVYPKPGSHKKYTPRGTTVKTPRDYDANSLEKIKKMTSLAQPDPVDPMAFDHVKDQILSPEYQRAYLDQEKQTYAVSILPREHVEYDFAIVGGGPAGLSTAIRLKQLALEHSLDISVCVVEKAPEIGAHVVGGDVLDPTSLTELLPNWADRPHFPAYTRVSKDELVYLSKSRAFPLPVSKLMDSFANIILPLGHLTRFLGREAEDLGVELFPGFAASEVVLGSRGQLVGVATADIGLDKNGNKTEEYARGLEVHAKQTIFAEGARGNCVKQIMKQFRLDSESAPQSYSLGIRETWEVTDDSYEPGRVIQTLGWPSSQHASSRGFILHGHGNLVHLGLFVGLGYSNPYVNPYMEMQQWKTHPMVRQMLKDGTCVGYGARVISDGGYQALPTMSFPGGLVVGCSAGLLNQATNRGTHNAIKSGIIAAESLVQMLKRHGGNTDNISGTICTQYLQNMKKSSIVDELHKLRNISPGQKLSSAMSLTNAAFELFISAGHSPWTIPHPPKSQTLDLPRIDKAADHTPINYPAPDNQITFSLETNAHRANIFHELNQPSHIVFDSPEAQRASASFFDAFEQRLCPSGVFSKPIESNTLEIDPSKCIHCKACDVKSTYNSIQWKTPPGGEGPYYVDM